MSELFGAMAISASGMRVQSQRTRLIAENIANSDTTATAPGGDPYSRKVITFKNEMDRSRGIELVKVDKIRDDTKRPFVLKYNPDHPAADERGYVKMPNVDTIIETMDMREANRSYEANLGMMDQARNMYLQTIDLLRR
jgi:flagellar basal-body rod protein FlgC